MGVLLLACGGDGLGDPQVVWTIAQESSGEPLGQLIGWNIGSGTRYAAVGSPHPQWRTETQQRAVARLAEIRPASGRDPLVRFSGLQIDGAQGKDGYHFLDHYEADSDNMAPVEVMTLMDELGGAAHITVNFGSGTSAEAADYVTHLTGDDSGEPLVALRAQWGQQEPLDVGAFEIGNEVYSMWNTGYSASGDYSYANPDALHGGDSAWHGRPSAQPDDYAARASEYVDAIAAVSPQSRFLIPLTQGTMEDWGGPAAAIAALRPLLERAEVAGIVIHPYVADDAVLGGLLNDFNDVEFLLSSSVWYGGHYDQLRALLAALDTEEPLQIAITEHHAAAIGIGFRLGDSPVVGLSLADQYIGMAKHGIALAMQHMILDFETDGGELSRPWHSPFRLQGNQLVDMPSLLVTELVAGHLLAERLDVPAVAVPTKEKSLMTGSYEYPLVASLFTRSGDRRTVAALLLHRDLTEERVVEIDGLAGFRVDSVRQYAAPDPLHSVVYEGDISVEDADWERSAEGLRVLLPPNALVAVVLRADN